MASYNGMPLSSGAAPANAMGLNPGTGLAMEGFEQDINFDHDFPLDDVHGAAGLHMSFPTLDFDNFATFDDPFASYSARSASTTTAAAYHDAPPSTTDVDPTGLEPASPEQVDNKLLGFSPPIPKASLVDDATGQFTDIPMTAELYGMFFVAEDVFSETASNNGTTNPGPRPLELTCYRRNLWQCSGQITLPRQVSHVVNEQGRNVPIFELAASITAIESIDGKSTEIVTIPWKSANAETESAVTRINTVPPNILLDLSSGTEVGNTMVSIPVSWKRLQFKHATANNGRRKGVQQHYQVHISLLGKMKSGEWMKICEIHSGPVIVRGRSPRNFDSKRDVPLMGDKKTEKRNVDGVKTERADQGMLRFPSTGNIPKSSDWQNPQPYTPPGQGVHPAKRMATSPNPNRPPIPSWGSHTGTSNAPPGGKGSSARQSSNAGAPIHLPLSDHDDERSPSRSVEIQSPQFNKTGTAGMGAIAASGQSALEEEDVDLLYEYFPLSLEDWLPPVDAVYRPHIVHHTVVPPEVKMQQTRGKTKRYFAAD